MTVFSFTDAHITINSVDASTWAKSVTLDIEADELDSTTFGGDGWKSSIGGLKSGSIKISLDQDFDAAQVDATLWPLLGTVFTVTIRPTSAAKGATNPEYTGNALLTKYSPMDGSVGDLAETSIEMSTSGAWTRSVS
jgi:hypothetical protein